MGNRNLNKAKKEKNDEFYTLLSDIEKELEHYKKQLKDKIILCNCDNPEYSNFWKYFYLNFENLGLKKLIATYYDNEKPAYKVEYDGKKKIKTQLKQNGDFRSPEAIEILKEADIVVTNPPFSLFREYMAQLMEYEKDFLIIGNMNAVTYKEIFSLMREDKVWLGYSPRGMDFLMPDGGMKNVNAAWFTNLDVKKRHEKLILYKTYNPEEYPKYDNYDAIEVSKVAEIPYDYDGIMGVPITYLVKHNPDQFEILGSCRWAKSQELLDVYCGNKIPPESDKKAIVNGKETYSRIFIKRKETN